MADTLLKVDNINVYYGNIHAVKNVSFEVNEGEIVTLIGANGAGKSTLFNAIAGSFITDSGSISLDGKDITLMPEHKRAKSIGRLFQDPMRGTAPGMTIEENLALAAGHGGWLSRVSKSDKKLFRDKLVNIFGKSFVYYGNLLRNIGIY